MSQINTLSAQFSRRLTKGERARLKKQQQLDDLQYIHEGVDFSRIWVEILLQKRDAGDPIEFEALGPYMTDYREQKYVLSPAILTPEDAIGLELTKVLAAIFPRGRLVSLYDDYNTTHATEDDGSVSATYTTSDKQVFTQSLAKLFQTVHTGGQQPLLISESSKVAATERLVENLERRSMIVRQGQEIVFVPPTPENPLYDRITLRTGRGKWLCAALDAAGFLHEDNRSIAHLIVLPHYMKEQQDKVWEILRALDISAEQYHNIFYDPQGAPEQICRVVRHKFRL